jgi:hypothetical protein
MRARSMTLVAVFVLAMLTGSSSVVFAAGGSNTRGAYEKIWPDARTRQLDREPAARMPRGLRKDPVDDPLSSLILG